MTKKETTININELKYVDKNVGTYHTSDVIDFMNEVSDNKQLKYKYYPGFDIYNSIREENYTIYLPYINTIIKVENPYSEKKDGIVIDLLKEKYKIQNKANGEEKIVLNEETFKKITPKSEECSDSFFMSLLASYHFQLGNYEKTYEVAKEYFSNFKKNLSNDEEIERINIYEHSSGKIFSSGCEQVYFLLINEAFVAIFNSSLIKITKSDLNYRNCFLYSLINTIYRYKDNQFLMNKYKHFILRAKKDKIIMRNFFISNSLPFNFETTRNVKNFRYNIDDFINNKQYNKEEILEIIKNFLKSKYYLDKNKSALRTDLEVIKSIFDNNNIEMDDRIELFSECPDIVNTEFLKTII